MDKFRECMFVGCVWIGGGSGRSLEEVLAWVGGDGEDGWKYLIIYPQFPKRTPLAAIHVPRAAVVVEATSSI